MPEAGPLLGELDETKLAIIPATLPATTASAGPHERRDAVAPGQLAVGDLAGSGDRVVETRQLLEPDWLGATRCFLFGARHTREVGGGWPDQREHVVGRQDVAVVGPGTTVGGPSKGPAGCIGLVSAGGDQFTKCAR